MRDNKVIFDSDNFGMSSAVNNRNHTNKGLQFVPNLSCQKLAVLQSKKGTDFQL